MYSEARIAQHSEGELEGVEKENQAYPEGAEGRFQERYSGRDFLRWSDEVA